MRKERGQFARLAALFNSRTKVMFEIGTKRPDGKYNIWHKIQFSQHQWNWIIDRVCDSLDEAQRYVNKRNGYTEAWRENA